MDALLGRPKRLRAMFAVIQVQKAAKPRQKYRKPQVVFSGSGISGPVMPMPPPVTSCQASAICVTMVAKPSVVMAK